MMEKKGVAIVYKGLTRDALVLGVSVEYFVLVLGISIAGVILFDCLSWLGAGLVLFPVGRLLFAKDRYCIPLAFRLLQAKVSVTRQSWGVSYYEA